MKDVLLKKHGRTKVNKLDVILAIACGCFAFIALFISLTISLTGYPDLIIESATHLFNGLIFQNNAETLGQTAVIAGYSTAIFYFGLLYLIVGSIALGKSGNKDRIPGLFAGFIAFAGFAVALTLGYDLLFGVGKGYVASYLPLILLILGGLEFIAGLCAIYYTLNTKTRILFAKDVVEERVEEKPVEEETTAKETPVEEEAPTEEVEEPAAEETPVEEVAIEETPVEEDLPVEESKEEEIEEVEEEEEKEEKEVTEVAEEENLDPFASLGKRRKRIPFENKMRRSKPETRERYKAIVSALRQYEFNDRKSIPGEAFSYKKERLIFLTFSGKTLKVYFKLDPKEFIDSPLPIKDASDIKKYEDTPSCLIVKSDLASRRVIALGERIANEHNIPKK